jgi:hypothetical protein
MNGSEKVTDNILEKWMKVFELLFRDFIDS